MEPVFKLCRKRANELVTLGITYSETLPKPGILVYRVRLTELGLNLKFKSVLVLAVNGTNKTSPRPGVPI